MTIDTPDATAAAPGCKSVAKLYGKWTLIILVGIGVLSWLMSRGSTPAADDAPVATHVYIDTPVPSAMPTTSSDQCIAEFQRVAAIDDMHDDVADLDNAMALCGSIDKWVAANELTHAIEGDPVEFLLKRCKYGPANRHGNACVEVEGLYPSGLYDHPYAKP